jgi:hypothetical protein
MWKRNLHRLFPLGIVLGLSAMFYFLVDVPDQVDQAVHAEGCSGAGRAVLGGRDTWAYTPAFGERRMSFGLPIGMIPLAKYERASGEIQELYRFTSADKAYDATISHCIDYLVIGPPERTAYPHLQPLLDAHPLRFRSAFRNDTIVVYAVAHESERSACTM